jgi:predicted nucleic acid-binding protein
MNITLSIDEQIAERAREKLRAVGKSLNQEIREHLQRLSGDDAQLERDLEFLQRTSGLGNSNGWKYNREDAYEDRLKWPRSKTTQPEAPRAVGRGQILDPSILRETLQQFIERAKVPSSGKQPGTVPALRAPRTFLDTNILLCCDDAADPAKQQKALALVLEHRAQGTGVVSLQVLQEYFVNATRKLGLDPALARQKVEAYSHFDLVEPVASDIFAAIDFHRLHPVSYWDCLVLHCAKKSGCSVVLTEDLEHGQIMDGVRIVNPFL